MCQLALHSASTLSAFEELLIDRRMLQLTRVRSQGIALHPVTRGRKEQRPSTSQEARRSVYVLLL